MQNADLTEKKRNIIKHKNLLSHVKTGQEILTLDKLKFKKINFNAIRLLFFKGCRY